MSFATDPKRKLKKPQFAALDAETGLITPEWAMQIGYILSLAFIANAWVGLNCGASGVKVNVKLKDLSSSEYYSNPGDLADFVSEFAREVIIADPVIYAALKKAHPGIWFLATD